MKYLIPILGLAVLMIVHEAGHHLSARFFGMRVVKFSIGFGPPLFKFQPKGSTTIYQVALIPFIAYVQIAGMNPFEESDPADKGSYANATVLARIATIFAGPFANYLFASVLFFAAFTVGGKLQPTAIKVVAGSAAAAAHLQTGDQIRAVAGKPTDNFGELVVAIRARLDQPVPIEVERQGQRVTVTATPTSKPAKGQGALGVEFLPVHVKVGVVEATKLAIKEPAVFAATMVVDLGRLLTGREKPQLAGPIGIVKDAARAAEQGASVFLGLFGIISTVLCVFNLLPFPALDGSRLVFLGYELITRRRPNAKLEAQLHAVGLVVLFSLFLVVSFFDIRGR